MNIESALDEFNLSLVGEIKAASRRLYVRQASKLLEFLGNVDMEGITAADLRRWRLALIEDGRYKIKTVNQITASVKRFFNFLVADGLLPADPAAALKPLQDEEEEEEPKALDVDDFLRLLNSAVSESNRRDTAIILVLFGAGCRVSGLCGLTLGDLYLKEGKAWVTEKGRGGGKSRWVYLDPPVVTALENYILVDRPNGCGNRVFMNNRLKPLSRFGVWAMLKRRAERSGVIGRFNPHAFRHTFAIEQLLRGQSLAALSQLMGHASIATTQKYYARYEEQILQELHGQYSPVNELLLPVKKPP